MSVLIRRCVFLLVTLAAACSADAPTLPPPLPPPEPPTGLLREIEIDNVPSPFYHFDYDAAGRIVSVSFNSSQRQYQVRYEGDRISELREGANGAGDRFVYTYSAAGQVAEITQLGTGDAVNGRVQLAYNDQRLFALRRERRINGVLLFDRGMLFSYHDDGNLREIIEHHPSLVADQPAITFADRFDQYDDKINVDGFSLLHRETGDHLLLLPGVQLQKGNPGRLTRTGDAFNFTIDFTYSYDGQLPVTKSGVGMLVDGSPTGIPFVTQSRFSYY